MCFGNEKTWINVICYQRIIKEHRFAKELFNKVVAVIFLSLDAAAVKATDMSIILVQSSLTF